MFVVLGVCCLVSYCVGLADCAVGLCWLRFGLLNFGFVIGCLVRIVLFGTMVALFWCCCWLLVLI